jgi:hypothetical protein
VNLRKLNVITKKNRYTLPRITELRDRLVRAKYFTKCDLLETYHRVRMKKGDKWKIIFRIRYELFEYLIISFGLTGLLAIYQIFINAAFYFYLDIFMIIYLDNILIYLTIIEEYKKHVRLILKIFRDY